MPSMKYGYARVSTDEQTPALQLAALQKAGCKTIFKDDGLSGATTKRPALLRCLKKLEHGDMLIVWKLDRLGRSLRDLITMLDDLRARGVKFHSLTEAIDTASPTGRAMWQMIGELAELERSLISERNPNHFTPFYGSCSGRIGSFMPSRRLADQNTYSSIWPAIRTAWPFPTTVSCPWPMATSHSDGRITPTATKSAQ